MIYIELNPEKTAKKESRCFSNNSANHMIIGNSKGVKADMWGWAALQVCMDFYGSTIGNELIYKQFE